MGDLNLFAILLIIFGILQIILFFKLWIMTNDVRKLTEHFCDKEETPKPLTISKEEKEKATRQVAGHFR